MLVDWTTKSTFRSWLDLRERLENSIDPFEEVKNFFHRLPQVKVYTDPYDQSTWPTPWELIDENQYCKFNLILGICYTLQLTERFKDIRPTINVALDSVNKTMYYLLLINDKVYGYRDEDWCLRSSLPKSLSVQKSYDMPTLH